jgi:hypothetical protein
MKKKKEERNCLQNNEISEIESYMQFMPDDWIKSIPHGEDRTAIELFDDFSAYLINNWHNDF